MRRASRVVVVGSGGTLGRVLTERFGWEGVEFRADTPSRQWASAVQSADVVIHAGGPRARAGLVARDYHREHVELTVALLSQMRRGTHLVYLGSTSVFGARGQVLGPATAEAPTRFPFADYACAKLAAESYVRASADGFGLAATVLRLSTVYGPGVDSVLETLASLARKGVRLELHPLSFRQHWLHVELLCQAIEKATHSPLGLKPVVLADPFVLTNRDVRPQGGWGVPLHLGRWARAGETVFRYVVPAVRFRLDALAALAIDNAFDWRPAFDFLSLRPEEFSRSVTFDPYWRNVAP